MDGDPRPRDGVNGQLNRMIRSLARLGCMDCFMLTYLPTEHLAIR
ncbi:hypothetical protein [Paenibacillus sp. 481]|nr:hypothetical protein [Paenibacillus sp. 481]